MLNKFIPDKLKTDHETWYIACTDRETPWGAIVRGQRYRGSDERVRHFSYAFTKEFNAEEMAPFRAANPQFYATEELSPEELHALQRQTPKE